MTMYRILGKRGRITIPLEIRRRMGFSRDDVLSFTENADGKSITVTCEKIPGSRKEAAAKEQPAESSLFDYLNSLSPEQQSAALVHLSVRLARRQGGDLHAGA